MKKKHIDEAQPSTVSEHFQLIMEDKTTINPDFTKVTPADLPDWFDEKLFRVGQDFYMENMLGFGTVHVLGLIAILSVPEITEVLISTNKSSTVCLSYKRYAETLLLMYELFKADMLDPNSQWFKAINTIRWRHANASKRRVEKGLHGIYQKDMAITQFGFIGFAMVCPEQMGLAHGTREQQMGYNHFWRITGYLLDIDNRLNICRKNVEETTELCKRIAKEILAKHLDNADPAFMTLAKTAINGIWYIDTATDELAFLHKTYKAAGLQYKEPLGWYSYITSRRREFMLYLCSVPYIGKVVRTAFNYLLAVTYWMLKNYPIAAWLKFGKKNSQICVFQKF